MNLVFATHNLNKLKEIQALLPDTVQLKSLADINCTEDIAEDASTMIGNALLKARYIYKKYGFDCFADDTGLEVEALNGEPGVYSARYAGGQKSAKDNMDKLLSALEGKQNRKARFKTVIALIINGEEHTFKGNCKGSITQEKTGESGFGYDPIFQPENYEETFAQMSLSLKNQIGHRGKAVQKLVDFLKRGNFF